MKISEFIKKLKDTKKRYGDLNVENSVVVITGSNIEFKKEDENPF